MRDFRGRRRPISLGSPLSRLLRKTGGWARVRDRGVGPGERTGAWETVTGGGSSTRQRPRARPVTPRLVSIVRPGRRTTSPKPQSNPVFTSFEGGQFGPTLQSRLPPRDVVGTDCRGGGPPLHVRTEGRRGPGCESEEGGPLPRLPVAVTGPRTPSPSFHSGGRRMCEE